MYMPCMTFRPPRLMIRMSAALTTSSSATAAFVAFDSAFSRLGWTTTVSAIGGQSNPGRECACRFGADLESGYPAGVLELADRPGLGPGARKSVWVRVPPPALACVLRLV